MSASDWEIRQLDIKTGRELDRAAERRAKAVADTEPVGASDSSLGDYWSAMQTLRLVMLNLNLADDAGMPLRTEEQILQQVDRARQALQVIACTAQFVGRK